MPRPPTKNPPPQHAAESRPTALGPTSSSHFPATAADRPRHTIAVEKIGTTEPRDQSAEEAAMTPNSRVNGVLKIDHAYTEPMHRWMAIDAGAIRHLGQHNEEVPAITVAVRSGDGDLPPQPTGTTTTVAGLGAHRWKSGGAIILSFSIHFGSQRRLAGFVDVSSGSGFSSTWTLVDMGAATCHSCGPTPCACRSLGSDRGRYAAVSEISRCLDSNCVKQQPTPGCDWCTARPRTSHGPTIGTGQRRAAGQFSRPGPLLSCVGCGCM